ncbi:hypothetical protein GUJ93_ZPchr0007g3990 [Zizania palustris]|uniref:Leucyl-tRNA synthetase editing domain-containing protein n=1 Tax=Zizania palustris TaxID=103762 RepID=A0A8J5TJF1_ZIZPA|nr:hypothetical protein GUJ93_ZPchr0007g3990 [Zizania palustris]
MKGALPNRGRGRPRRRAALRRACDGRPLWERSGKNWERREGRGRVDLERQEGRGQGRTGEEEGHSDVQDGQGGVPRCAVPATTIHRESEASTIGSGGKLLLAEASSSVVRPSDFALRYLVLAPEHTLLPSLTSEEQLVHVEEYRELAARKSELERTDLQKEKTGFFSGSYAKNPTTKEIIPI